MDIITGADLEIGPLVEHLTFSYFTTVKQYSVQYSSSWTNNTSVGLLGNKFAGGNSGLTKHKIEMRNIHGWWPPGTI